MQAESNSVNTLLPHLFRQEYAKLTAVLSRYFGLQHMEAAEDIASDTFLKATEHWAVHGIPPNPAAWLYAVAKNKARDYLKRNRVFEGRVKAALQPEAAAVDDGIEITEEIIADSQLLMMFAVCDAVNPPQVQISLALQILCGFSVEEIASAFLLNRETVKKRLQRGRANLHTRGFELRTLHEREINARMDVVLKTLYLLFNEGYFSHNEEMFIRKDLCAEAMRLTLLLAESGPGYTGDANALLALMCFQSSRLDARMDDAGVAILYEDQDRGLWNRYLIEKGNEYLYKAFKAKEVSTYHLQAAIAYWHTTNSPAKWTSILQLYNQLIKLDNSPATAINRTFAIARVHGSTAAIQEAEKLSMPHNSCYYGLIGYLHKETDKQLAITCYRRAVELTRSKAEKRTLLKQIAALAGNGL